jgi:hypothetical protein
MTVSAVLPLTGILWFAAQDRAIETAVGHGDVYAQVDYWTDGGFFPADPGLQSLAWPGEMKVYIVAAAIALVSMPFVVSQLDG